ncbi:putative SPX domain-containing protein [Helianthus annuus]|uniref:SPX domain-containing protein n=1 Tax=Helianthus annuus TaxID=4232 RepID=A0A9K3EBF4_HELAN|nr:putative SPX domain-containing protein [Helianthus annuus]KAJ0464761.1 putative SPX domain-containing protein [Helianthus annuus]KAJ0486359.1 putative SPX domain-containing protein [Helianthus annuus]KAJ0656911.1 putative SPX domain-containing protein [Helianthus annuus]KAJ0660512.1 putative SPX domain-containing protein [Helianthus annuus]
MVPEWEEAYMQYNHLKTILKEILIFRRLRQNQTSPPYQSPQKVILSERHSLYTAFSGLTNRVGNYNEENSSDTEEVILVTEIQHQEQCMHYQTMFFRSWEEGAENEIVFFKRLDDEFNKAICFYKRQVDEVVMEAEELNKQMDALFALKVRINDLNFHTSSTPPNSDPRNTRKKPNKDGFFRYSKSHKDQCHTRIRIITAWRTIFDGTKSDLSFNKRELRTAQAKLKQAFVEFHRKLRLLKSYCFLNQLAISKIMKKYDKVTSRNASKAYLEMVKNSYLSQSDEVVKLMDRVESAFITHFANANRSLGMKDLRPRAKKDKHGVTFFVGCFFGCLISLVVAVILTIRARDLLKSAAVPSNLEMEMDERTLSFTTLTELVPLGLFSVLLLIMICPLNIMYRASRFFLIVNLWHCVCAPLYKVTFPDFFLGDQLTSQVQLLRTVKFYICYYGWGDFKRRSNTCNQSSLYEFLNISIPIIPNMLANIMTFNWCDTLSTPQIKSP